MLRDEVLDTIRLAARESEDVVASVADDAWDRPAYPDGWNAHQVLAHLALTSGVWSLAIRLASMPPRPAAGSGAGRANMQGMIAAQMTEREAKAAEELLAEIRSNSQQAIDLVSAAPDELLAKHLRTPWGTEGTLGEVIAIASIKDHFMVHLADLAAITEQHA